jgi:hypothetical protein
MKKTLLVTALLTSVLFISCEKEIITPQTPPPTTTTTTTGSSNTPCSSAQCTATTQSGSRCKRMTTNCNRRCYQH